MLVAVRPIVPLLFLIVVLIQVYAVDSFYTSVNFIASSFSKENTSDIEVQTGQKSTGDVPITRTKSEHTVYRVVLRFLPFTDTPLTIREDTGYILQLDKTYHLEQLSIEDSIISDNTWNDFITINQSRASFPNTLQNTHSYMLLDQDAIVSNEAYPHYIFSRVGFNDTYTQAIVYLGTYNAFHRSGVSANGGLYYLERVNRQWRAVSVSGDWVTE